jgi:class 3 adenylate cyclase/tetratricopeptide (TPR) repeat protein
VICSNCGAESAPGKRFCAECGTPLAATCPSCGAAYEPGKKFCADCGSPLAGVTAAARTVGATSVREVPADERRLVSVLFADLVGFTTLSESRDSEEVRDLLSRYFETCTKLIGRYGGVVEKFIGDAVMAVWGSPVATEDDAERAVRAALDLVSAVEAFGAEVGAPDLRARAGVLTGEAAVTLGSESEGMVLGDMVNTASRIQSAAQPGSVMVGESTRWATEAAVVYENAGMHELKGKAEPLQLWRAARVVSGKGGEQKAEGLEAPFVGRDRELRLVKEAFHASADEGRAHLVSVTGPAGIGKSRLAWEFYKYFDGLVDDVYWHRGRCPSYGDGVAYWALAEMVKMRCRISEEESGPSALGKLRAMLELEIADPEERVWIEPRLASLIGVEEASSGGREELFSAWRLLFERLSETDPTIMVFEDIHWADSSLLDFIEYLLEWSRNSRLFIVTLGRPELADRRPNWGAGKRNFTSLYLEPMSEQHMRDLLSGLVPGLPSDLEEQILGRSQGVPLYAVETVRMLMDRGLLVQEGSVYRPSGPIDALEVPDTLHALLAARLDGLDAQERLVVQDGAVLGKTFFKEGVAAVSGLPEEEVERMLASLVRKEILTLQSDPRSPERGQYGFLQDLVKQVAYGMISKKERKAKHLEAAAFIRNGWEGDEDEVVEVVASHYLAAYESDPAAEDAAKIKSEAQEMLQRAGERASSLGASHEAQRYFERSAALTDAERDRATLTERAGEMALAAGRLEEARDLLNAVLESYESSGDTRAAAGVAVRLAEAVWAEGRIDEAVERGERAFAVLSADVPDPELATLAALLGRLHFFLGEHELSEARLESALEIAEELWLPEVLSQALNTKGILAQSRSRPQEGYALTAHALTIALENDRSASALRAYNNLAEWTYRMDRYEDATDLYDRGLILARRAGNRLWFDLLACERPIPLFMLGRWDEALAGLEELADPERPQADVIGMLTAVPLIHVSRGDIKAADHVLEVYERYGSSPDVQEVAVWHTGLAVVLGAHGRLADALEMAERAIGSAITMGADNVMVKVGLWVAIDACLATGDLERARAIVDDAEGRKYIGSSPVTLAIQRRCRARLEAATGGTGVGEVFDMAIADFRRTGCRFWLAATLTEHGEWLRSQGSDDDAAPRLHEARSLFEQMRATAWLERLDAVEGAARSGNG